MNILLLDISDDKTLLTSIKAFFGDRPVYLQEVSDVALFETLSGNTQRFTCGIALVNSGNAHTVKSGYLIPTTVYRSHTYTYKKLLRFYREQGGGDG